MSAATLRIAQLCGFRSDWHTPAVVSNRTANQPRKAWEAKKKVWGLTEDPSGAMFKSESPQDVRHFLDEDDAAMTVTMNAMEVKTFLVTLA